MLYLAHPPFCPTYVFCPRQPTTFPLFCRILKMIIEILRSNSAKNKGQKCIIFPLCARCGWVHTPTYESRCFLVIPLKDWVGQKGCEKHLWNAGGRCNKQSPFSLGFLRKSSPLLTTTQVRAKAESGSIRCRDLSNSRLRATQRKLRRRHKNRVFHVFISVEFDLCAHPLPFEKCD